MCYARLLLAPLAHKVSENRQWRKLVSEKPVCRKLGCREEPFLGGSVNRGGLFARVQSINLAHHIPNPLPCFSIRIPYCLLWGALREHRGTTPRRNHPHSCRGLGPTRAPLPRGRHHIRYPRG